MLSNSGNKLNFHLKTDTKNLKKEKKILLLLKHYNGKL